MDNNEYKYALLVGIKNMVIVIGVVALVLGLFWMSQSWWSLLGLLLLSAISSIEAT